MAEQRRVRVLIVDDDPIVFSVMQAVADDHPVVELLPHATTPEEAMTISRQSHPDAILLDHTFPAPPREPGADVSFHLARGLSGLEAVQYLRSVLPDAVIAVYTGTAGLEVSAEHAGADLYLLKGEDPHVVLDTVAQHTLRRR